ncbi:head-tail adaptor [Elusimicrobium posterum]|uniref:phage head completion protein n=1 Tax=Elusimicrobium posterum TaxID=3116653 RepID=UPI003C70D554
MSFASLLNTVCDLEITKPEQQNSTGENKDNWEVLYRNVKCRLRNRSVDERVSSTAKYMNSTHALYTEYLKINPAITRAVIKDKVYNITGILNMGGGHEYLCLYLEVME